jgi:hypothetical protein
MDVASARRPASPDQFARADQRMAAVASRIVFVTVVAWTAAGGSGGGDDAISEPSMARYVVYSLPFTLGLALLRHL